MNTKLATAQSCSLFEIDSELEEAFEQLQAVCRAFAVAGLGLIKPFAMKDLGTLIREAKDHLGQKTVVPANVSKWQQGRKLVSFATKVKGKLDPDLWAAMFPRKARWQKGVLALEFWID